MLENVMTSEDVHQLRRIRTTVTDAIKDHDHVVDGLLVALLTGGHVLLESNPGLGKTSLVKAFAGALGLHASDQGRIQFTPDLMPADITGTLMPRLDDGTKLEFTKGPIFRSILLADEINRATPKTQSAMLEAMAERQVTVLGKTYPLPGGEICPGAREPFMVIATQNPIDQEGTYELPEAQTDRFMFKFQMRIPSNKSLRAIVDRETGPTTTRRAPAATQPANNREEALAWIDRMSTTVRTIRLHDQVSIHATNVVLATNGHLSQCLGMGKAEMDATNHLVNEYLEFPLGPRAAIQLGAAAKGYSVIWAEPERAANAGDKVREGMIHAAIPVLRHRLKLKHGWQERADATFRMGGAPAEEVRERVVYEFFRLTVPRIEDVGYARLVDVVPLRHQTRSPSR